MQFHFDGQYDGYWRLQRDQFGQAGRYMCGSGCQEEGRDGNNGLGLSLSLQLCAC